MKIKDPGVFRTWHRLFTHKIPSASSNVPLSLNFYNLLYYPFCHHALQIALVPRHNKMTRMWDCRDVPVYWVFTRHMSSFCCFSFPSIFPVVPTAAALTPLQNFRQAHLLLPVCALLSAEKRHVNIDWKSLMKSSQAVLRKSCDRLFLPGFRKST